MKQIITRFTTDAELARKFGGWGSMDVEVCGSTVKFGVADTWLRDDITVDVVDAVDTLGYMLSEHPRKPITCQIEAKSKTMDGTPKKMQFQRKTRSVYENTNVPASAIESTMETYISVGTGKCTIILAEEDVKEMLSIFSPAL